MIENKVLFEIIEFILKALKDQGCDEVKINNYLETISKLSNSQS